MIRDLYDGNLFEGRKEREMRRCSLELIYVHRSYGTITRGSQSVVETSNCRRGAADRDEEWKSIVEIRGEGKGDTRRGLLLKYGLNDRVVFEEQEPLVSLLYRGPN